MGGCTGDTAGKRVTLKHRISFEGADTGDTEVVNKFGFRVRPTRMVMSVARILYYDAESSLDGTAGLSRRVSSWLLPSAHAHPGHEHDGSVLAEMRHPALVDFGTRGGSLPDGSGVTGQVMRASLELGESDGSHTDLPPGYACCLQGVAWYDNPRYGDDLFPFRTMVTADELRNESGLSIIDGCPVNDGHVDQSGRITLTVRPAQWLDHVNFAGIDEVDAEGVRVIERGMQPFEGLVRGLVDPSAYRFDFEAGV